MQMEMNIRTCGRREAVVCHMLLLYPGSIKVLLDSRLGASSGLDDLSVGCQDGQQSDGKHLEGVHLFLYTLQVTHTFSQLRK